MGEKSLLSFGISNYKISSACLSQSDGILVIGSSGGNNQKPG